MIYFQGTTTFVDFKYVQQRANTFACQAVAVSLEQLARPISTAPKFAVGDAALMLLSARTAIAVRLEVSVLPKAVRRDASWDSPPAVELLRIRQLYPQCQLYKYRNHGLLLQ
jgi:hypothetical protein